MFESEVEVIDIDCIKLSGSRSEFGPSFSAGAGGRCKGSLVDGLSVRADVRK